MNKSTFLITVDGAFRDANKSVSENLREPPLKSSAHFIGLHQQALKFLRVDYPLETLLIIRSPHALCSPLVLVSNNISF